MMKVILLAFLVVTQTNYVICDSNEDLSKAANCFTLNFYKELSSGQSNMVSSPFSLDVLLSMLMVGSGSSTAQQLQEALGYGGLSNQDIEDAFQSKLSSLKSSNGNTLDVANSIWIQKDFPVEQNYKDAVTKYFSSTLSPADFKNDAHRYTEEINNWAKDKTQGLIPKLFDQDLDSGSIMVLLNAIYFKGKWESEFKNTSTKDDQFFTSPDTPTTTKFMNQRNHFSYTDNTVLKAEILEMNYKGKDMSMMIILPREGTSLEEMEGTLTCDNFRDGLKSGPSSLVDVKMPKFEITSSFDLVKPIQKMGITDAFSNEADFSGVSKEGIKISKAIQKAVIKVYEEGSEAAVVTGIGTVRATAVEMPPRVIYFKANRPFVFLIKHVTSDLVLFMGKVEKLP